MEKNNLSGATKSIGDLKNKNNKKTKDSWDHHHHHNHHVHSYGDHIEDDYNINHYDGFSWPPRSYTCSFCKREFRSAQALGGHMNVHRRDRARLRQYSPTSTTITPYKGQNGTFTFLNPNPNFSSSPSSSFGASATTPLLITCTALPNSPYYWGSQIDQFHLNPHGLDLSSGKMKGICGKSLNFDGLIGEEDGFKVLKKGGASSEFNVRLDLEIGLVRDDSKDDLDLELRLGTT